MRKCLIIVVFATLSLRAISQMTFLAVDTDRWVYVGFPNSISAVQNGCPCDSINIVSDNGSITPFRDCEYFWNPGEVGTGTLTAFKMSGKDTLFLGSKTYDVRAMKPSLGFSSQAGELGLQQLLDLKSPLIKTDNYRHINSSDPYVISYSLIATRNNKILFTTINTGKEFVSETTELIKTLKSGDILTLYNIICRTADGRIVRLEPVEYTLTP